MPVLLQRRQFVRGTAALLPLLTFGGAARAAAAKAVVVTLESDRVELGFAGDDAPRATLPTVDLKHAANKGAATSPIQRDIVTNLAAVKVLIERAFAAAKVSPTAMPVLVTESPANPTANRHALCQMLFDELHVPAFFVVDAATLALYASGRTTGIVALVAYDVIHAAPVYEGYPLPHAYERVDLGRKDVLGAWRKALNAHDAGLVAGADDGVLSDIDAHYGYVALDFAAEKAKKMAVQPYTLPSGKRIALGSERFLAPEVLFEPPLAGLQEDGLAKAVFTAIMKSEVDVRKDLYNNVVLCGSGSGESGLAARLTRELQALAPGSMTVKVIAAPERMESSFIGGSIVASLSTFSDRWITAAEYRQSGVGIVDKKCR